MHININFKFLKISKSHILLYQIARNNDTDDEEI